MAYIESISLSGAYVNGVPYPRIHFNGLRVITNPLGVYDFFTLERAVIPKSDSELVSYAYQAMASQSLGYYMRDEQGEVIHMSRLFGMSEYGASVYYKQINIEAWFRNNIITLVDNTVDTTNNFVVYRVIYSYLGEEVGTNYVFGLLNVSFINEATEEIVRQFEAISLPTISRGTGSLMRNSMFATNGNETRKGIPYPVYTPRYRGPIESIVTDGFEKEVNQLVSFFMGKIGEVETAIRDNSILYDTISYNILKVLR